VLRSLAIDRGDENFPQGRSLGGIVRDHRRHGGNAGVFKLNPRTGACDPLDAPRDLRVRRRRDA
jgi:hypothetical protein